MGDAIFKAIPAIMAEIDAIGKNRKNEQQGYKFRGIDDVYNELHPLLTKYKVFTVPEILEEKDEVVVTQKGTNLFYRLLKIKYTFFADDGSNVVAVVRGEGMDSGDKASNKAMAVAHKYALMQIFSIPTEDAKDPENDSHETVAKPGVELVDDKRKALVDRLVALGDAITAEDKEIIRKTLRTLSTGELGPYVEKWEKKVGKPSAGVPDEKVQF